MKLRVITKLSEVKKFLHDDPDLAEECLPDDELVPYRDARWWPDKRRTYVGAYDDGELIGVLSYIDITNITIMCHMMFTSDRWGLGKSLSVGRAFEEWIKENTKYYKLLIYTPEVCSHVLKYTLSLGFRVEATLTGSIYWRDAVRNMILLTKYIDRSTS